MIISFLVFLVILGIIVFVHEFGHFIMAKYVGVRVDKFSLGFGPKLLSFKRGDTEYLLSLIPLGGYVKMAGDIQDECQGKPYEYLSQKVGKRAAIVFFGPVFNYILALFCFCLVFFVGYPTLPSKVGEVMDNYPAQEAGVLSGDQIIQVDGEDIDYWEELQAVIHTKTEGSKVDLIVRRDNEEINISILPKIEKIKSVFGQEEMVALIGIKPAEEFIEVRYGFFESIKLGTERLLFATSITYRAIFRMITGNLSFRESVTGPLGILYFTDKVVNLGFNYVLHMIAILGTSLAIFNLLPLPILDGGHLLFLLVEKLRKKPLSRKVDDLITNLGFSLIVIIAVFVTFNDLIKFGWIDKIMDFLAKLKKG